MKSRFFKIKNPASASKIAALFAGILAVIKFYLYLHTGLLVVALSALDSIIDVFVSFINNRVIQYARQHADEDHPYGHGKAESIAAMAQGMLISSASLGILFTAFKTLFFEVPTLEIEAIFTTLTIFFIVAALLSFAISRILTFYSKKFKSIALHGDAQHYTTDVISNMGSALALMAIAYLQYIWLDAAIAIFIALYLLKNGVDLVRKTVDELMDHDLPDDIKNEAFKIILDTDPLILDVHRFRGRQSGERIILDFHISLPDSLAFKHAHEIADMIENKLEQKMNADVIIHVDPVDVKP